MSWIQQQSYGGGRKSRHFYVAFTDQIGVLRKLPTPTRDEEAAREYLRKLEWLVSCRLAKLPIEPELSQWIQGLPLPYRQRLADLGLIDSGRVAGGRLVATLLQEFETAALARGCKKKTARMQRKRAAKVFELAAFQVLCDINRNAIERALTKLIEGKLSHQSRNHYLAAAREFCGWTASQGWSTTDPTQGIARLNVSANRKRVRRALEPEEVAKLLDAAASGPVRRGVSGPERRLLYLLAIETGARKEELAALTVSDLTLKGDSPAMRIRPENTKNKRDSVLPLRPPTAADLDALIASRRLLPERGPQSPVFSLPKFWRSAEMLSEDLADAGILKRPKPPAKKNKRKVKAPKIGTMDADGFAVDFHSLRHTTSSYLARAGVPVAVHQALMRHSDPRLSMNVYTHLHRDDERNAIAKLPDFSGSGRTVREFAELRPTGSDVCRQVCRNSAHQHASQSNAMPRDATRGRTRRDSNTQQPVSKTDALSN